MPTMTDRISREKESAVRRFADQFQNIPGDWGRLAAEHLDDDECVALPMWGTLFMVSNMDEGRIRSLMGSAIPTDAVGLLAFAEEHGIETGDYEMEMLAFAACDEDHDDVDLASIRDEIVEAWRESGNEDAFLADCGWEDVGSTGFIAREIDGRLVLGVNGCGYSFHDSHWLRLYDELGFTWHKESEREQERLKKRCDGIVLLREIVGGWADEDSRPNPSTGGMLKKILTLLEGE